MKPLISDSVVLTGVVRDVLQCFGVAHVVTPEGGVYGISRRIVGHAFDDLRIGQTVHVTVSGGRTRRLISAEVVPTATPSPGRFSALLLAVRRFLRRDKAVAPLGPRPAATAADLAMTAAGNEPKGPRRLGRVIVLDWRLGTGCVRDDETQEVYGFAFDSGSWLNKGCAVHFRINQFNAAIGVTLL